METKMKITITFKNKRKVTLKDPKTLTKVDKNREVFLLFDNTHHFSGYTDGEVDIDGEIFLSKKDSQWGISVPFERLVGWCYMDKKERK